MKLKMWTFWLLTQLMAKAMTGVNPITVSVVDRSIVLSPTNADVAAPGYLLTAKREDLLPFIRLELTNTIAARLRTAIETGKLPPKPPSHKGIQT